MSEQYDDACMNINILSNAKIQPLPSCVAVLTSFETHEDRQTDTHTHTRNKVWSFNSFVFESSSETPVTEITLFVCSILLYLFLCANWYWAQNEIPFTFLYTYIGWSVKFRKHYFIANFYSEGDPCRQYCIIERHSIINCYNSIFFTRGGIWDTKRET